MSTSADIQSARDAIQAALIEISRSTGQTVEQFDRRLQKHVLFFAPKVSLRTYRSLVDGDRARANLDTIRDVLTGVRAFMQEAQHPIYLYEYGDGSLAYKFQQLCRCSTVIDMLPSRSGVVFYHQGAIPGKNGRDQFLAIANDIRNTKQPQTRDTVVSPVSRFIHFGPLDARACAVMARDKATEEERSKETAVGHEVMEVFGRDL